MILSPNAFVPTDALKLNEDIQALERIVKELESLDIRNITDQKEDGVNILRMMLSMARLCQHYATLKMRNEYLAPPKKIERPRKSAVK